MFGNSASDFIRANTDLTAPPLIPEIRLHQAREILPLWIKIELAKNTQGPPPYWAFAWPGGQALARYLLDHRHEVTGKSVLDFGAGSGLVAIAAAKAGAKASAADIDPLSAAAICMNARANDVSVEIETEDIIGQVGAWDCVLIGDMCYERPLAERLTPWLHDLAARGARVLLGDPGRNYFPESGVERIADYKVPTLLDLEDTTARQTGIYRLVPA